MGTASTMACDRRGAGDDAARQRRDPGGPLPTGCAPAEASGRAALQLARERADAGPYRHAGAVENAMRVLMAIGGSTNAVIHLTAIAGRAGIDIDLQPAQSRSATRPRCSSI